MEADFKSLYEKMDSELWVYSYTLGKGRLKFEYFFFVEMDAFTNAGCISNYAAKEYPILRHLLWKKNNLFPYIFLYSFSAILLVTRELPPVPNFHDQKDKRYISERAHQLGSNSGRINLNPVTVRCCLK